MNQVRRLGVVLVVSLLLVGCGEREGPPPIPDSEVPEAPVLLLELPLVYHRGEEPVEVNRQVAVPPSGEDGDSGPILQATLRALLEGPTPEERASGIHSFFGGEMAELPFHLFREDGLWIVDFADFRTLVPNAASSAGSQAFLRELTGTLSRVPGVVEVELRLEGECEAFWNFLQRSCERIDLSGTMTP